MSTARKANLLEITTTEDHVVSIGNTKMIIPKGSKVDDLLNDVSLYGGVAQGILGTMQQCEQEHRIELDSTTTYGVEYLLQITLAMADAAHDALRAQSGGVT